MKQQQQQQHMSNDAYISPSVPSTCGICSPPVIDEGKRI